MKTVYFAQHGVATPKEVDEQRPLSAVGNDETHNVASCLKKQQVEINKIAHSGKLRALQTASIFAEVLGVDDVIQLDVMNPNDDPSQLIQQISQDKVLHVGHLPNIQKVISTLICHENSNVVQFQNSAVVCIEMNDSESSIKWFLTPQICRNL